MEDLIQNLNKISLKSNNDKILLYVDGMNYSCNFFTIGNHWSFRLAFTKIKKFVDAANNSNISLKIFLDAFIESDEAIHKWRMRREEEIKKCKRNMPQSMNVLIGEMFKKAGVEVCYSVNADNDDTLASYAQYDNAHILSRDKDFIRYINRKYKIYEDFKIIDNKLILIPRKNFFLSGYIERRQIIYPKPIIKNKNPGIITLPDYYLRGSPSPLTKTLGNLHLTVRSLRQAYYASLNIKGCVKEEFPEYIEDKGVVWNVANVEANDKLLYLLKNPKECYAYFFKDLTRPKNISDKDWKNHKYATFAIVLELCAMYMDVNLYDLLCKFAK